MMTAEERAEKLRRLDLLGITEASVRKVAQRFAARFPTRGDWFTLDQVERLLLELEELRAERDTRMALFNTAAEIAGAAIEDLQTKLAAALETTP